MNCFSFGAPISSKSSSQKKEEHFGFADRQLSNHSIKPAGCPTLLRLSFTASLALLSNVLGDSMRFRHLLNAEAISKPSFSTFFCSST